MFFLFFESNARCRALVVACLAGGSLAWGSDANAIVLIDDFSQTESPSPYPLIAPTTFPTTFEITGEEFGAIAGIPSFRVVNFGPLLSADQVQSGVFDGSQTVSVDTATGRLTSTSVGDGAPLLQLAWSATDPAADGLNLDLTAEAGLLIRFETNLPVDAVISILQIDETSSSNTDHKAGNADTVTFQPGVNSLFIPFSDFNETVTESRIVSGPPFTQRIDLAPIGLDEVDTLTLLISPVDDPTVPEGLVLSFDQFAFVPEPTSLALLGLGTLLLARRRQ